ncbi:hypothetical protein [Klebsiella quasipneumoniae]|uniref:hypothetical protein n=1 Tax=Klebsiella quasipneumoniae TaxID=1463165 RepID=UPI000F716E49|nr:hypothetical protein [Klebsiella quasipneumoniae]MDR4548085.1 hypothetical protein [Klebsiella quasipneumoniae]VEB92621.1 Uncharacterised protein [Klebsiella quasipneumoniae]HBR2128552.1 hypothetical protein [Klebsiella variicola]
MATQFENGLTLSQLAERNAELVTEVEKLRAERDASLNAERVWEKTMMEVCGEDGPASVVAVIKALAAENVALKSNLMFWDADNPELPYDSPEEIASECSLNYNEEFVAQVAAKLPNRTYRVYESWESDCKLELVEGADLKTPATDAYLAGIKADAITASLDACSDYLETDCVMDRLDISYEDAEKRTSGAIDFHDAMVNFANQLREGADK